ncbi:MAG TPA: hypothetical protein VF658_21655 [Pyrinomonadaceae bacterium]|jgi:hypothetical protein
MNLLEARRAVAVCLCAALLLPFCPTRVVADDGPRVIIEIGQPSVWSLGQAHYLLAKMHRRNRKLSTRFPDENDLDSNRVSATRIDALRQSIGVEGQFDQAMGTKNDLALKRFREGEVRRETARADLLTRQKELQTVNGELAEINEQIALLTEEDRQSKEARDRATPPAPPTAEDNDRKKQLVLLNVRKSRKEEERTELKSQITSLTTTADTPTAAPTFEEPALTTGNGALPNPATFQKFMDKALAEAGKPELAASMKLDNFVGMQYEIISKQLTLLRDEVSPDDRVIFLELPASLYTVDGKADDYIAQVEWKVKRYCDKEPPATVQAEVITEILEKEGKTSEQVNDTLLRIDKVRGIVIRRMALQRLRMNTEISRAILLNKGMSLADVDEVIKNITRAQEALRSEKAGLTADMSEEEKAKRVVAAELNVLSQVERDVEKEVKEEHGESTAPYPITLEMVKRYRDNPSKYIDGRSDSQVCSDATAEQVRAIDIIPRQSALNVNEYHATVKETMFLAAFKFLIGFAGKVNFQRQRELYEQFVQQQVFASGYGKGDSKFGWTYGPQPGTKRISPGLRTTFAVLVVPRTTLAVELSARGRYYKRNKSPHDPDGDDVKLSPSPDASFFLSVPGKRTQEFWVDGISYSPVRKGKRVTAVIDGNYFSPQLGIMVNGVPLEPVVSISRAAGGDEEADVQSADGVAGEYEITNSRQIVLSFTMGDNYVGTPTITFTSPEKSTPINFFDLEINHHGTRSSLQEQSVREPMFIEDFGDKMEIDVIKEVPVVDAAGNPLDTTGAPVAKAAQGKFKLVRIKGAGMRPGAEITLNDSVVGTRFNFAKLSSILNYVNRRPTPLEPFVAQDSTKSYILYFPDPKKDKWKIGYRHLTRQGYEDGGATKDFSTPAFATIVRNYRFDPTKRHGEVDLTFASNIAISEATLDDPVGGACQGPKPGGDNQYRVKCFVPAGNAGKLERDFITVKLVFADKSEKYEDIRLPVRPMVTSVVNPRTGYAAGFTDEEPTVIIAGVNLQGITSVFFGDKEAKIIGAASPDAIAVKVPKGVGVSKGQAVAVPVIFQTAGGGQVPSGAVYTYLGEPLPPNVIVWPPSAPGKLP